MAASQVRTLWSQTNSTYWWRENRASSRRPRCGAALRWPGSMSCPDRRRKSTCAALAGANGQTHAVASGGCSRSIRRSASARWNSARKPVLAFERGVNHHARHPCASHCSTSGRNAAIDDCAVIGSRGCRAPRRSRRPRAKGAGSSQPGPRQLAESGRLAAPHQFRARDLALRIALAHAHQGLAVLVHLDAPAGLLPPPAEQKPGSRAMDRQGRDVRRGKWLHYADPALALCARSRTWPQYADYARWLHWCRSSTGSYVPVGDNSCRRGPG